MSQKQVLFVALGVFLAGAFVGCPSTPPQMFQFIFINVGNQPIIEANIETVDGSKSVNVLPVAALAPWEYVVLSQEYSAANTYALRVEFDYDADSDGENETAELAPPSGLVDPSSLTEDFITWHAYYNVQPGGARSWGTGYNYGDQIFTYTDPVPSDVTPAP